MATGRDVRDRDQSDEIQLREKVVNINRVAKVVAGGRRFSLTALVVVGDGHGRVAAGYGKANEVPSAIQKAIKNARKELFDVPMRGHTITHEVIGEHGAARVVLKPASAGTGIIAGGPVRAVLELAGIRDILTKSLGSNNPTNVVHATIQGLRSLRRPEEVAGGRNMKVADIFGLKDEGKTPGAEGDKNPEPGGSVEEEG